jgi:hypothetical protein
VDDISRSIFLVDGAKCVNVTNINLLEGIVRSISCFDRDLLDIPRIRESIDINELDLWIEEDIFRKEVRTDESCSSGDDDFLGEGSHKN